MLYLANFSKDLPEEGINSTGNCWVQLLAAITKTPLVVTFPGHSYLQCLVYYIVAHDVCAMVEPSLNGCLSKCTEELVDKLAWRTYITRSGRNPPTIGMIDLTA